MLDLSTIDTSEKSILLALRDAITLNIETKKLQNVLKNLHNVNAPVVNGLRLIHYAAFENNIECVDMLVRNGAIVNVLDDAGFSPLHLAAKYGYLSLLKYLIDAGSIVNFHSTTKFVTEITTNFSDILTEPLSLALENNHLECAQVLIENGANVNQKYFLGWEINLLSYRNIEALSLLLKYGADPNVFSRSGITPLAKACKEGNISAVKVLLDHGANPNIVTLRSNPNTPVTYAVSSKRTDILDYLLRHGASPNRHISMAYSPLGLAICNRDIASAEILIKYHANVNEFTTFSRGFIHPMTLLCSLHSFSGQKEFIKLLLENSSDPNYFCHHGEMLHRSALYVFLRTNDDPNMEIVSLFIQFGAKVTFGRGPYSVLRLLPKLQHNVRLVKLLLSRVEHFNFNYILECLNLDANIKNMIFETATNPMSLKKLARKKIYFVCETKHIKELCAKQFHPYLADFVQFKEYLYE